MFSSYTASTVAQLIAAIDSANSSAAADTITIAAGATFALTAASDTTHGATGLPRITGGGGLTIVGNGATLDCGTTVECRFFDVAPGASLTLSSLTLQNGAAYSPLAADGTFTYLPARGGAIYNEGTLTLSAVTIQNSSARGASGGFWGTPIAADAAGGGIYSTGALAMSGCTIRNNAAIGGYGQSGGFIYADMGGRYYPGSDGRSAFGGGVCVAGGSASITNSTFTANTAAGGNGGSGYGFGSSAYGGNGGDGLGGGLYASNASVTLRGVSATSTTASGGLAGLAGNGNKRYNGSPGRGIGGGVYRGSSASLALDDFTLAHVINNIATTSSPNIAGSYKRLR
jgi:hypothetical protein